MSLRKTQLKKMTIDEIMLYLSTETDPDSIKLINNYITDKNHLLIEKKNTLLNQIADIRQKVQKSIKNLNGRVKDRIDKKQTIILDKDSRPTPSTITDLMSLFSYLESQAKIITRNNNSIKQVADTTAQLQTSLRGKAEQRRQYDDLDRQFEELNSQCKKEQKVRDTLIKERDQKRSHYANIHSSIQTYRKQYDKVEAEIRIRERELIQLSGYYQARSNEDMAILQELPAKSLQYQQELLQAQQELNACRTVLDERRMLHIERSQFY